MSDVQDSESAAPGAETPSAHDNPTANDNKLVRPREVGGRKGPEPTRYGDWEKAGRCIDF